MDILSKVFSRNTLIGLSLVGAGFCTTVAVDGFTPDKLGKETEALAEKADIKKYAGQTLSFNEASALRRKNWHDSVDTSKAIAGVAGAVTLLAAAGGIQFTKKIW